MRVLLLNYGPQSGVVQSLAQALRKRGGCVAAHDVSRVVSLRGLRGGPNLAPRAVLNALVSFFRHGRSWRRHLINTPFAFDALSADAGRAVRWRGPEAVLQCGALFAPGRPPSRPYALYLDHTRAISEAYPPAEGLADPVRYGAAMRAREMAVYRGAAVVLTMSEFVAYSLARDYQVHPAKVRVVGAGANILPAQPRRDHDGRTVLFVGKDFARKGGPALLRAFRELRRRVRGALLRIVGPRIAPAGADQPGVEFLGPVPLARMGDLFARATVFALPTLREPFGLAYLDAMACAVPCVGTSVEAVPEIIDDGETGFVVPPGEDKALCGALVALLGSPHMAQSMGYAGRRRVEQRFNWDQVASRAMEALASIRLPVFPPREERPALPAGTTARESA